jgi:hypothetical protein
LVVGDHEYPSGDDGGGAAADQRLRSR